jgi:septum formation protein
MPNHLILASNSKIRSQLLTNAGVPHTIHSPMIDEEQLHRTMNNIKTQQQALYLATQKSLSLSKTHPDTFIIGADQTLTFDMAIQHKPKSHEDARASLTKMRGKSHRLHSAVAISRAGVVVATCEDQATITFRDYSDEFLDAYLNQTSPELLKSVGSYQFEQRGISLIASVEGDYFTILGLPLLPLLHKLRGWGVLPS